MKNKGLMAILFWGGLWGLSEATVSYLLHLFLLGFGWAFYYPLAYLLMRGVYWQTEKASSILWASGLAAAIKLINLFMTPRIDYVINPAVCILLEGLVVFCAVRLFSSQKPSRFLTMPFITSIAWRGLYLLYLLVMPQWIRDISALADSGKLMSFLLLETVINTIIIGVVLLLGGLLKRRRDKQNRVKFVLSEGAFGIISVGTLILSVYLQLAL